MAPSTSQRSNRALTANPHCAVPYLLPSLRPAHPAAPSRPSTAASRPVTSTSPSRWSASGWRLVLDTVDFRGYEDGLSRGSPFPRCDARGRGSDRCAVLRSRCCPLLAGSRDGRPALPTTQLCPRVPPSDPSATRLVPSALPSSLLPCCPPSSRTSLPAFPSFPPSFPPLAITPAQRRREGGSRKGRMEGGRDEGC